MEAIWNEIENLTSKINNKTIWDSPISDGEYGQMYKNRDTFVKNYSWAIPSREAINQIVEFWDQDTGIETGAGSGLWAHLLQLNGIDIIPTDTKEEKFNKQYTVIEQLEATEAIKKYSSANVLFLCWSRINPINQFRGNKIVYIGEDEGGCTDGVPNDEEWELTKTVAIPQWPYIHDYVGLYMKK